MLFLHSRPLASSLLVSLFVSLGFIISSDANAGQKVDIYRADALVTSQAESERNAAARATLGELVVRVSGQRSALDHPAIKAARPKAQNYLFGFSYKSTSEKITVEGKTVPAVGVQLDYAPQAIEKLLRESQLPLWPAIRPKVLVWLVVKDVNGLRMAPEVIDLQAMQSQAQYRGLPLSFPKTDAGSLLTAEDLWALNLEKIKEASLSYKVDAVLVGRYTPSSMGPLPAAQVMDMGADGVSTEPAPAIAEPAVVADTAQSTDGELAEAAPVEQGPWLADWQLLHADDQQVFTDETPDVKGLFVSAIDQAADYFANQYAIMPTNQGPQAIVLRVTNITNFAAFKQVQAYIDDLAIVQRMEVIRVNADGVLVRVTTEGDVRLLMNTLALGRRLAPVQSDLMAAPVIASEMPMTGDTSGIDAEAMAELDRALANEQIPGVTSSDSALEAPVEDSISASVAPIAGGTVDNPLMYVWQ
ncbi:DUF2066 domain-containing protein [Cellvibrio sp. NN19]|uniref:DUF2066 domain-containing protein n=1 Tax=Cellvibrio chitinivorans TaxID=3102792 RepID=UPI002B4120A1|nr:DUF2066 domain-containing protein [Cellvibrio sp. NN19]